MPKDKQTRQEMTNSPREIKGLSVLVITPLLPFSPREINDLLDVLQIPMDKREIVSPDRATSIFNNGLPYNLIIYSDKCHIKIDPKKDKLRKYFMLPHNQPNHLFKGRAVKIAF